MSLLELRSKTGRKKKKRIGRGNASGHGTYSCKGMKGQTARSGGKRKPGFEGGQTPYLRKMPKLKGFKNPNRVEYQAVNIGDLNIFDDKSTVNAEALYKKNLISKKNKPVKLLAGKGSLEKSLTIEVDKASAKAIELVEAKKGKVQTKDKESETKEKESETKEKEAETKEKEAEPKKEELKD